MPENKISIEKIVDDYYQKIYKLSFFYLKDKQESEEITQEIFLKVIKKLSTFKGQANIYTWIYRIASNTLINYLKRKKLVRFLSLDTISIKGEHLNDLSELDPAIHLEINETKNTQIEQLEKAINLLSNKEKKAFYLFYYDNLKQKEIAQIMKISKSAVESLIHKAKKKLKKNLKNIDELI